MENKSKLQSLMAVGSLSNKEENQDSVGTLTESYNIMMVADGVGSSEHARLGSQKVIEFAKARLGEISPNEVDLKELFKKIQEDLDAFVNKEHPTALDGSFATTLIIGIERDDKFQFAYVGNGGILHLKGNITEFNKNIYFLPWVYSNYLNPHSVPINGKEVLDKFFAKGVELNKVTPTIIEISKDKESSGDVLIICTDGIYSKDQVLVSKDPKGKFWLPCSTTLQMLLQNLKRFLEEDAFDDQGLHHSIMSYLHRIKNSKNLMTDDCSLGILVTKEAQAYQNRLTDL